MSDCVQALAHPWIKNRKALAEAPLNEAVVKNLKQHAQQNRFQRAVRHKMAMHLTTDELHRLRNMFEGLDTDGTGTVSIDELSKVRLPVRGCCHVQSIFMSMWAGRGIRTIQRRVGARSWGGGEVARRR